MSTVCPRPPTSIVAEPRASAADDETCGQSLPSAYERSVIAFRSDPRMHDVVEKNYLDPDLERAVTRFSRSREYARLSLILARHLGSGSCLADLGCGRGLTSLAFARAGINVVSVEQDPSNIVGLGALAEVHELAELPLEPLRATVLQLPFRDDSFRVVFCRSLLHHLTDIDAGLREVHRILKPGGLFLAANEHIVSPFSTGRRFRQSHPAVPHGVDERAYPTLVYTRKLRRAGFSPVSLFGFPFDFTEFTHASQGNRIRSAMMGLPVLGGRITRLLHFVHIFTRRYLLVPETSLPAISIAAFKAPTSTRRRPTRRRYKL